MARSVREPNRFAGIAVDLVNTARDGQDFLVTPYELREFLIACGEPEPVEVTIHDVLDVVALRGKLRAVFAAETESEAAALLNAVLAESATAPYLSHHPKVGWHLHVAREDADWAEWLGALTATGLAELISAGGFDRMRVCAAQGCRRVLLDESRNHSQRFCCSSCATRTRVNAYRARQS
jgi:predicted RNA-binding Zn ribbon-like protein